MAKHDTGEGGMQARELTDQIVVRVDAEMRQALEADARANERTMAQQVRYIIKERLATRNVTAAQAV